MSGRAVRLVGRLGDKLFGRSESWLVGGWLDGCLVG